MHNMIVAYCDVKHANWSGLLPFVQIVHNTACSCAIYDTHHYLMFGRMPTLPVDVNMGMPQAEISDTALQYTHQKVEYLQLASELARQNFRERAETQAAANKTVRYIQYKPGDLVLVHQPHVGGDDGSNKLLSPWRGSYHVRHRLSPVVYRVSLDDDSTETAIFSSDQTLPPA